MPHYFDEFDTTVHFVTHEEHEKNHSGMTHEGDVRRSGADGDGSKQRIEFNLNLESNPEFAASVLVACARAVGKMAKEGQTGAATVFDIPLGDLSSKSPEELRKTLL